MTILQHFAGEAGGLGLADLATFGLAVFILVGIVGGLVLTLGAASLRLPLHLGWKGVAMLSLALFLLCWTATP